MRRALAWGLVAAVALSALPGVGQAQSWRNVTMSRQISGEDDLRVQVTYGAGHFKVGPAERGVLYRMQLRYDEELFEPHADYENNRLRLGVENIGKSIRLGKKRSGGEMDLMLGRDVPMDLDLEFGAVRAELDLGGLTLTGLALSTGASESVVDISEPNPGSIRTASFEVGAGVGEVTLGFDGSWRQDATVSIDMGLGALELRFPEGLGVRLTKDSFLTSLDSEGMVKRGDAYYSLDWETADRKVSIDLNAAFGSVKVVWVR